VGVVTGADLVSGALFDDVEAVGVVTNGDGDKGAAVGGGEIGVEDDGDVDGALTAVNEVLVPLGTGELDVGPDLVVVLRECTGGVVEGDGVGSGEQAARLDFFGNHLLSQTNVDFARALGAGVDRSIPAWRRYGRGRSRRFPAAWPGAGAASSD